MGENSIRIEQSSLTIKDGNKRRQKEAKKIFESNEVLVFKININNINN